MAFSRNTTYLTVWRFRDFCLQNACKHSFVEPVIGQNFQRLVWSEAPSTEKLPGERFYDSTVEKV